MPNVVGPNTVSFGSPAGIIAPDIAAQQIQLARQQQIIDMLKQRALTPDDQQVVTGAGPSRVVPYSPMQGLSKVLSAFLAGKSQDSIDSKNLEMSRDMAQRYAQILANKAPDNVAAPAALAQGAAQGSVGPTVANGRVMDTMTQGQPTQGGPGPDFSLPNLLRGSVVGQMGGAPAAAAYWDNMKTPEQLRTADMLGIPRSEIAAGLRRETAAKGQTMVREGSTITQTQPDGSVTPMFTAPDMKQGANITWQGGVPQAAPIQGLSAINAGMAGAQTQAQEQVKAGLDMVTVNTPQGPKMMTRAQAVQLAQGGAPAAGGAPIAPPGAAAPQAPAPMPAAGNPHPVGGNPPPGSGVVQSQSPVDRLGILQSQLAQAQRGIADPSVNDADRQRLQNDVRDIQSEMARMSTTNGKPNGLAQAGIPLQTEGQQKFEQTMGTQQADILTKSHAAATNAADSLMGIGQARAAVERGAFQGSGANLKLGIAKFINANVPGVKFATEKVGDSDYLKSILGEGLLKEAKTLGSNPSNADAQRINDIVGDLTKDPAAMKKILDWRQMMAERAIELHNGKVTQAIKNGFQPQFDMTVKNPVNSADIDALLRKYGGK